MTGELQMSIDDLPSKAAAVDLKRDVLDLVGLDPRTDEHRAQIVRAILTVGVQREVFSANDCREHIPAWVHTPSMGQTFSLLRRRHLIEFVAYEPSTKKNTHGHPVGTWRLTALGLEKAGG